MYQVLCEVRKRYGGTYVSLFEDGLIVPWRTLTLEEYISYSIDQARGVFPSVLFEDEIFKLCVLDPVTIQSMDRMNAGIVTTIAGHIWEHSGPHSVEKINQDLDIARTLIRLPGVGFITEMVQQIIAAYPAYKPEDLYSMDYETFLRRAVLAEDRLMRAGAITEPLAAFSPEAESELPKGQVSLEERKRIVEDYIARQTAGKHPDPPTPQKLTKKDVEEHGISYQAPRPPPLPMDTTREKWWKISPVLEATKKKPVHFDPGGQINGTVMSGWDLQDLPLIRAKMIEDAQEIYKDLIAEVERRSPKH